MGRRRGGKKIDYTHWTGSQTSTLAFSAGSVAAIALPASHEPETLLRIRGSHSAFVDSTSAPGLNIEIACGLIPVPEGTGATVLWSPITDADAPWIWYTIYQIAYEEMVTDVIGVQAMLSYREVIDNKAMRIFRNQELQLVAENVTLGAAGAVNMFTGFRALTGT